jgi:heptosyltransferase III
VAAGMVDRVCSIEAQALAGFFARNGSLAQSLSDYFSGFDLIISYLYDPDDIFRTNVARCSAAQFIAGPHRPVDAAKIHATKVYLQPLERLAIFDADHVPHLPLNPQPSTRNTLALHPGSGSERKNWPEASWAQLLERLVGSTDFNLLLVGGEAEGERLQRLTTALPPLRSKLARNLPLPELARMLQPCLAFVGHDSGISHLAAALGLPGLLLWGDTAEDIWRPPSPKIAVLRHPGGLAQLTVEEVMEQILPLTARNQTG